MKKIILGKTLIFLLFTLAQSQEMPMNGFGNNIQQPEMNIPNTPLLRDLPPDYPSVDGMAGEDRKSPREISNIVSSQTESRVNSHKRSSFVWQWGQFIDHDIGITEIAEPHEPIHIEVPLGDPYFDPNNTGNQIIAFNRSKYIIQDNTRQQLNNITGWIDGSMIYGSRIERMNLLRTLDGTGKLRTSEGNFLPRQGPFFFAGDVRANEQLALLALHTLFVREHNRLAEEIHSENPQMSGDEVFFAARERNVFQIQAITYREFLPALLGRRKAISKYKGYKPHINTTLRNVFTTAAYRFGHSMLSSNLLRLNRFLQEIPEGHISLKDAFFVPDVLVEEGGIEPLLRGLAYQPAQDIDIFVVDEVRNFLFGEPGSGGFDLAALNIQRGRDHGLPSYNAAREKYGFKSVDTFEEISSNPEVIQRLKEAYETVDDIDLWVGGLAEDHVKKALVGPLFYTIIVKQFQYLRDGDRFFYRNQLSRREARKIRRTKLSDIIRRNTNIDREIPRNVFKVKHWRRWLIRRLNTLLDG